MFATGDEITRTAKALQAETHRLGLTPPAFRASPRAGHPRALRRYELQTVVVVRSGRELYEMTRDMIDGVLAANKVTDPDLAEHTRSRLWEAAGAVAA